MGLGEVFWGVGVLRVAERQQSKANESFAEYVVERLETCILSVSALMDHLRAPTNDQQASAVGVHYSSLLGALLQCLQRLSQEWESYLDQYQLHRSSTSYTAPMFRTSLAGLLLPSISFNTFVPCHFRGCKFQRCWVCPM